MTPEEEDVAERQEAIAASLKAVALAIGRDFGQVVADFGEVSPYRGITIPLVCEYLATLGYATQPIMIHDPFTRGRRRDWPPTPWGPAHFASVERERGYGKRFVAVTADGTVHDAMWPEARTLAAYERVIQVVAVHKVATSPFPWLHVDAEG